MLQVAAWVKDLYLLSIVPLGLAWIASHLLCHRRASGSPPRMDDVADHYAAFPGGDARDPKGDCAGATIVRAAECPARST